MEMKEQEVIRSVMREKQMTQGDVAKACGMKGQSSVSMLLQGKSMRVDNFLKVLNACGYDVIVKDREGRGRSFMVTDGTEGLEAESEASGTEQDEKLRELVEKIVEEKINERMAIC